MYMENSPFPKLAPADFELIAEHGTLRTYPKHTVLISEGDRSDSLYVIRSGRVKV